jgi:hypothetical protein
MCEIFHGLCLYCDLKFSVHFVFLMENNGNYSYQYVGGGGGGGGSDGF